MIILLDNILPDSFINYYRMLNKSPYLTFIITPNEMFEISLVTNLSCKICR